MLEEDEQDAMLPQPEGSDSAAHSTEGNPEVRAGEAEPQDEVPQDCESEDCESEDCESEDKEPAPMLDVHPPHEGIHTWKEYLLHMSTIVLGLLIAIGLEQSVEALHRARERRELRASLNRDSKKIIADALQSEQVQTVVLAWIQQRRRVVQDAVTAHRPVAAPLAREPYFSSIVPINPAWNAAKSSGLLPLLTQEEVEAYSEMDSIFVRKETAYDAGISASKNFEQFESRYADPRNQDFIDLSSASPAELDRYIDLLDEEGIAWTFYSGVCGFLRGGETAVLAGERDLGKIQKAELQFFPSEY